ncbi:RICIN domain-containing protein [Streptomyces sp. NPDC058623]|uniref:RICIN domain-containing protein n=1 Tax=Streptomyces sp. NPDC058623 TaxID=3346563 RepID=UPI0036634854
MSARSAARRAARYVCAVTLGAVATLGAAPQASAKVPPGDYRIVTFSGLCWEDNGLIKQQPCDPDNEDQVFNIMSPYSQAQSVRTATGECLDSWGEYEFDNIYSVRCEWDSYDQEFTFQPLDNGKYRIAPDGVNRHSCLDVFLHHATPGAPIVSGPCWGIGKETQQFELVRVG